MGQACARFKSLCLFSLCYSCSSKRFFGPVVKGPPSSVTDLGSLNAFTPGDTRDLKSVLQGLLYLASGDIGSALGLVGPV